MSYIAGYTSRVLDKILSVCKNSDYYRLLVEAINELSCTRKVEINDNVITSVAEHCAIFNRYNTISNCITLSVSFSKLNSKINPVYVVLAGSLIPLDNADYPRGIILNSDKKNLVKLSLWEQKKRKQFPLYLEALKAGKFDNRIEKFEFNQKNTLLEVKSIFQRKQSSFVTQVSATNIFLLEKVLFSIQNIPKIIYLSLEEVANRLLIKYLSKKKSIVEEILINNSEKTFTNLYGVPTCWTKDTGSFLFWYNNEGKLKPLKLNGECLTNEYVTIPITKVNILNSIVKKEIYPSVFTALLVTVILPNIGTVGGKQQGVYLKKMIDYVRLYNHCEISDNINNVNWGIHPPIGPYLVNKPKKVSSLYLASNPPSYESIKQYMQNEKCDI